MIFINTNGYRKYELDINLVLVYQVSLYGDLHTIFKDIPILEFLSLKLRYYCSLFKSDLLNTVLPKVTYILK